MHDQPIRRHRKALTTVLGAFAMIAASTVVAGAASIPRTEVSLTDASAEAAGVFIAVSPLRVLDTRPPPLMTGVLVPAPLGAGQTMTLALAGEGKAVPSTATSVMLNVTIDQDAPVQSFLTIWPTGENRPLTSANNALPGLVAANSMVAKLGTDGSISIFNQTGAVNIVIDVVGYLVPLSGSDAPALASGAVAPTATDGTDGDFYVDTTNNILYGPKANGAWPLPGVALGGVQGAATAFDDTPHVTPGATGPTPLAFATAGPSDGSVALTNPTTFTVAQAGLYAVDYHLNLSAAALGEISVFVDGVQQGPSSILAAGITGVANTVLVTAAAASIIQLDFTPTVNGATLSVTTMTIVVEQATAN